jgi:hypothetical protein
MNPLKLTEQIASEIQARVKSLDLKAVEKLKKGSDKNGTFDVIISTEVVDRAGEIVRQSGWDLTNYKNNPIVLWGHDYYSLPIGVCVETYITEYRGVPALGARGVFYPEDINPLAQQVRRMYDYGVKTGLGVGCTTSVGFIPREFEPDNRSVITRAELLEFSFVPVPANQGVGPAEGRALTFDEAKELQLDVAGLKVKGLEFVEAEKKEEEPPASPEDKSEEEEIAYDEKITEARASQKKLTGALKDEHDRHIAEIDQAFDDFHEKAAAETDKETAIREACKDLRDTLRDEHLMHRAKAIGCFKAFDPAEDKAFDKRDHLKALRGQTDEYETKTTKLIDEFEEKVLKTPAEFEDLADLTAGKLEEAQRAHLKAVTKAAKGMCKAAFGEEEKADEKVLEILKEHLSAFVPEQMQTAVFLKVGARISASTKAQLGEAHQLMKAASAIVETLHGALGNDDGEEGRSEGAEKSEPSPAPRKQRSRPTEDVRQKEELDAHLLAKDILRGITTSAMEGLKTLKQAKK